MFFIDFMHCENLGAIRVSFWSFLVYNIATLSDCSCLVKSCMVELLLSEVVYRYIAQLATTSVQLI